ncbi:serine/threonine-protein kinase [Frankia sp. CiP3]|uniref:serine/threonine-protein kinase n=1 Tax=Frankia sp. CiP3 TaxID=2880971 RepID=UPI001EF74E55|nr:serine/threonine-protein kinase [Frankia sp. CiP3]
MLAPLTDADPRKVGRYWLQGRLGAGGMGTVYLGFDDDGHPLAVKVIRPELINNADFRKRFRREVAAARRVRGNYVAEVRDADVDAERPWMATEYVDGVSLATAVAERGRLGSSTLVNLATGLADALVAVHTAGLVHRDLKPSNILLAWDGPKVIDFGIAHAVDTTEHTQTGHVIGTVAWMAPEQLRGERAGPAADVFSWAMCVVFAATGRHPFAADTPTASALRMLREEPDLSGIPDGLRPLTLQALNRDPGRRPTAVELVTGVVRNYVDSVDLADQVTRHVLIAPPLPPPSAPTPLPVAVPVPPAAPTAPAAGRAGNLAAAGQPAPAGRQTATTHRPPTSGAAPVRRWQLALVTVAAGIALGITAGLAVAVALRVASGGGADIHGAIPTPVVAPAPSGSTIVPTVAGVWTSGRPGNSAGMLLSEPSVLGEGPPSAQPVNIPPPPSAEPIAAAPNAANVAKSTPREPVTSTQPDSIQMTESSKNPTNATRSTTNPPATPVTPVTPQPTQTSAPPPATTAPAPRPTATSGPPATPTPRSPASTASKPPAATMQPVSTQSRPPPATASNVARSARPRPRGTRTPAPTSSLADV